MNKQHARSKMKMIILTVLAIFVIAILMAGLLFRQAFPAAPRFKDLPVSGDSTVSTDSGLIREPIKTAYTGILACHTLMRTNALWMRNR